jgi:hypothetical protein
MLGNLYVAAKYWAYGYSDGMANAGGNKGKQRRRYLIGDRQYWADESELPGLILAVAAQPEKQPEAVQKTRAKAVKRAANGPKVAEAIPIARPRERTLESVLEALREQFTLAEDEVLLRSLAIAAQRLAEQEEDDEMVLLAL